MTISECPNLLFQWQNKRQVKKVARLQLLQNHPIDNDFSEYRSTHMEVPLEIHLLDGGMLILTGNMLNDKWNYIRIKTLFYSSEVSSRLGDFLKYFKDFVTNLRKKWPANVWIVPNSNGSNKSKRSWNISKWFRWRLEKMWGRTARK